MNDAFAPPEDARPPASGPTTTVAAWALAGGVGGTALGAALELTGLGDVVPFGLGGGLVGAAAGWGAWALERQWAAGRPEVHDARGRRSRPPRSWLLGIPLALGLAGLLGLVVIGTVHTGRALVGLAFLLVAVGFAFAAWPLWSRAALTRALELAEEGRTDLAEERLLSLFRAGFTTRSARAQAAVNLGLLALLRGDLDAAAGWYSQPRSGSARAFARSGLALVRVLQGHHDGAEEALREASTGGRAVQVEVDGVRLLLVLRRDGPAAARALGDRLASDESGALFLGVLAAAHRATGNPDGASALLDAGLERALRASTLTAAVPELAALVE